jgi:hypothetical protein
MIQRPREADPNRYWDDPVKQVKGPEADFDFIDYFGWDVRNYADFQCYRVRVGAFPQQPHLVGREALLEHLHAGVFVNSLF